MLKKALLLTSLVSTTVLCSPSLASHPSQPSQSYHGIVVTNVPNTGGYFVTTLNAMTSAWVATDTRRFILHGMWLSLADNSWIETGYTKGGLREPGETSSTYYDGFYNVRGKFDANDNVIAYQEYRIIGPSTAVNSTHSFYVSYDPTENVWGVWINGTRRKKWFVTAAYPSKRGVSMDVGIESSTTLSASAQWNERRLQTFANGVARPWTQATLYLNTNARNAGMRTTWQSYPTAIYTSKVRP